MGLRDSPDFESNLNKLQYLIDQREEAREELNQHYLTVDSIIDRLDALNDMGMLNDKRVLTIGDADLTGLAIAIFGNPSEVVVADIDDRLSEIYFEATMEYDLPVRFVYHDMRIKIIAILKKQYTLVLTEPPQTEAAVKLFLSRALEILEPGKDNRLVFSVPSELRTTLQEELSYYQIKIKSDYPELNRYIDGTSPTDFIELDVPDEVVPKYKNHFVQPLFEQEVTEEPKEYKCVCRETYTVGETGEFETYEELENTGCKKCDYNGVFAYKSDIQLK